MEVEDDFSQPVDESSTPVGTPMLSKKKLELSVEIIASREDNSCIGWLPDALGDIHRGCATVISVPLTATSSSLATGGFFTSLEKGKEHLFADFSGSSGGMLHDHWISQKIRQCGQVVGISMENCNGGWHSLVAFGKERVQQNNGHIASCKSKQRVRIELQGWRCSINYDKGRSQVESEMQFDRGEKRS